MIRALVTGGTGMLGSYVVERLLALGATVRVLVRHPASAAQLQARDVEIVPGDLLDRDAVRRASRGTDVIFHTAAAIGAGSGWEGFRRGNVEGTRSVVEAAGAAGARLVHVSSTAVFGRHRFFEHRTHEEIPLPDLPQADAYGRSKQEAERLVRAAHDGGRAWAAVVRPPVMYGLRDRQFVPRMAPVLERGVFPLIAGGTARLTLVHADAVAAGMILAALHDDAGGRVYHLTEDVPVTIREMVTWAAEGLDRGVRFIPIPGPVGCGLFRLLEVSLRLAGRSDLARHVPGTLSMLTRDNPFSCRRARQELGWTPTVHPQVGLPAAFRYWRRSRLPQTRTAVDRQGAGT